MATSPSHTSTSHKDNQFLCGTSWKLRIKFYPWANVTGRGSFNSIFLQSFKPKWSLTTTLGHRNDQWKEAHLSLWCGLGCYVFANICSKVVWGNFKISESTLLWHTRAILGWFGVVLGWFGVFWGGLGCFNGPAHTYVPVKSLALMPAFFIAIWLKPAFFQT